MSVRKRPYPALDLVQPAWTYAIVDRDGLQPLDLAEDLFRSAGAVAGDRVDRGTVAWQHGSAAHLIVLHMVRKVKLNAALRRKLKAEVRMLNERLLRFDAMLLPTGAHPFLLPASTAPWSGERDPLHVLPGTVFDRRVQGWVNSMGATVGLPFGTDEEFARLHAAIRLLMPILPALCASSPLLEGKRTGFLDSRLEALLHVHDDQPEFSGSIIPEAVFTQEDHDREVLGPIARVLAPFATRNDLDHEAVNARGAVTFFDQGQIELRTLDVQEHPGIDLDLLEFVLVVLKALMSGRWVSTYLQRAWDENDLLGIYLQVIKDAGSTLIANRDYLLMFGLLKQEQMTARRLWQHLFVELYDELGEDTRTHVGAILEQGCLASRILARTGREPDRDGIIKVYKELATCLAEGRHFA
jgi:carboxylate-amine ligase